MIGQCFHRAFLGLCSFFIVADALSQETDILLSGATRVAEFSRAGRMAVAPDGRIFVTERDKNVLLIYTPDGRLLSQIGGPGTDEGEFYDPTDVDPGIGLVISVADTKNGRVQRFTKDFRFLESLPVMAPGDDLSGDDNPSFRTGSSGVVQPSDGRPIAVTSSATDDLYVIENQNHVVIRWDRDRTRKWVIGDRDDDPVGLIDPIDLVTTSRYLYVADSGCECVYVFDLFGTFIRIIAEGQLASITGIDRTPRGILIVTADRLLEYTEDGTRIRNMRVELKDPLRDAAYFQSKFILLTERALFLVSE